jgi:cyclopropane fatty-acyl-phospholipid synthase-like methyltransferase
VPSYASLDATARELQQSASDFDSDIVSWESLASARQYRRLVDAIADLPLDARVLDWGSGRGGFSYWLLRRGQQRVDALDLEAPAFSPALERIAEGRFHHTVPDDHVRLPYPDETFDAVVSVGVFEHVGEFGGDETATLGELRRVLKPGGCFVCVHLPNEHSWIEALSRRIPGKYHHQRCFAAGEMEQLLTTAGFKVELTDSYGVLPRNSLRARWMNTERGAAFVDGVDDLLLTALRRWAQNRVLMARKPTNGPATTVSGRQS